MNDRRCSACQGFGKIMGGGMIYKECFECRGTGKIQEPDDEIGYLDLKNTESYKKAITTIKESSDDMTTEKAEKLFEEEFNKTSKKKRGPKNEDPR